MGTDIATGASGPTPDAVQPSPRDSGLAGTTPVTPGLPGDRTWPGAQGGVFDAAGQQAWIIKHVEADARAAQATAMDARDAMLAHYQAQTIPIGGQLGDDLVMPVVPDNALVPASSDQYPWPGDEPVPSSAGPTYQGNVPN